MGKLVSELMEERSTMDDQHQASLADMVKMVAAFTRDSCAVESISEAIHQEANAIHESVVQCIGDTKSLTESVDLRATEVVEHSSNHGHALDAIKSVVVSISGQTDAAVVEADGQF